MCDVYPVFPRDCHMELRSLINDDRLSTQVCLDLDSSYIELFDDYGEIEIPENLLRLPTAEELLDFPDVLRRYVDILDTPIDRRPMRYLHETGRIQDFRDFYTEEAISSLVQFLKDGGYSIKDASVKYEIATRVLKESLDVEIPEDKIKKLVLAEDNIRCLIGYVCKYIAAERLKRVDKYSKEHPGEVLNCTIKIE